MESGKPGGHTYDMSFIQPSMEKFEVVNLLE